MGNLFNFDKSQMYYLQNDEIYLICMCESQIKKKYLYETQRYGLSNWQL